VRRRSGIGPIVEWLALLSAGCLPFFGGKTPPPRTPEIVERFAAATGALGIPPSPPPRAEVTRLLGNAVQSLPRAHGARGLGQQIDAEAQAMHGGAAELEPARRSLALALDAIDLMKKPAGSTKDREAALKEARLAVAGATPATIDDAFRSVARALVLVTGGQGNGPSGAELPALVARMALADSELARRTGGQAVYAIAGALSGLGRNAGELRKRADRLANAAELDYAPLLKEALALAVDVLGKLDGKSPAFERLRAEARDAVERIATDRPFELQRPVVQDALRLIADALTIARSAAAGR
jgi:hypothetical protein